MNSSSSKSVYFINTITIISKEGEPKEGDNRARGDTKGVDEVDEESEESEEEVKEEVEKKKRTTHNTLTPSPT
ncbi:hypothetical protein Tco_1433802 [Tanacetum coccineum]